MKHIWKIRKYLILAFVCVFSAFAVIQYANAVAVDKLTIKIGYFGFSASEYVEKEVFTASELYNMGTVKYDYTYWDGSKRVAIDSSIGVPLSDILDAAGIDQGSIAQLDFWTSDSGGGAFTSFTWKQLIGTKRYYFKDLAACFEYEGDEDDEDRKIVLNTQKAWKNASRVPAMMALEENWTWYEIGTSDAAGTDSLGTANRFRLNFGQSAPDEKRTFNSAKMVHTIYVMFSGSPKLISEDKDIKGKVGSTRKIKITAAAADEALEEMIQGNIVWSSSDSSIVSVDEYGNLTFNKEGTVTITARSGSAVKEFKVTVGDEDKKPEDKKEEPEQTGGGGGDGNGNGNGTGKTDKNASEDGESKAHATERVRIKNPTNSFVLSDEASARLRTAFSRQAASDKASMNTHQEEMDEDATQLEIKKRIDYSAGLMVMMNGLIGVSGALFGVYRYRKQRWG